MNSATTFSFNKCDTALSSSMFFNVLVAVDLSQNAISFSPSWKTRNTYSSRVPRVWLTTPKRGSARTRYGQFGSTFPPSVVPTEFVSSEYECEKPTEMIVRYRNTDSRAEYYRFESTVIRRRRSVTLYEREAAGRTCARRVARLVLLKIIARRRPYSCRRIFDGMAKADRHLNQSNVKSLDRIRPRLGCRVKRDQLPFRRESDSSLRQTQ